MSGPARGGAWVAPEVLVVVACVALLGLLSVPPTIGLWTGLGLTAVSFGIGTMAGAGYHVALHRALSPLPRGWWINPTRLHDRLTAVQRRRVIPWFVIGASGFVGSILGCAAFLSAALRGGV